MEAQGNFLLRIHPWSLRHELRIGFRFCFLSLFFFFFQMLISVPWTLFQNQTIIKTLIEMQITSLVNLAYLKIVLCDLFYTSFGICPLSL